MKYILIALFAALVAPAAFAGVDVGLSTNLKAEDYKVTVSASGSILGGEAAYTEVKSGNRIIEASVTAKSPTLYGFGTYVKAGLTDVKDSWLAGTGITYALGSWTAKADVTSYRLSASRDERVMLGGNYSF